MLDSILCFVAHPDDETITCGGTFGLLAKQGVSMHIVCATRGEGGELGEPPVCSREELPAVREAELRCAVQAMGGDGVTFLGYEDPLVGPDDALFAFEADFDTLVKQISDLIRQHEPALVLTHGIDGEYGHPAHLLMHQTVKAAMLALNNPPLFYTFAASVPGMEDRLWNQNEPAHLALDIRPWLDVKVAAGECHASQHALFMRSREAKTVREALRTVEAYYRYLPPLETGEPPHDDFADMLRAAGAWQPEHNG